MAHVPAKFLLRRDTKENWSGLGANKVLDEGEPAVEFYTDPVSGAWTTKLKIGHGDTWANTDYIAGSSNVPAGSLSIVDFGFDSDSRFHFSTNTVPGLTVTGATIRIKEGLDDFTVIDSVPSPVGGTYTIDLPLDTFFNYQSSYTFRFVSATGDNLIVYSETYDSSVSSYIPTFTSVSLYSISPTSIELAYTYQGPSFISKISIDDTTTTSNIYNDTNYTFERQPTATANYLRFQYGGDNAPTSTYTSGHTYRLKVISEDSIIEYIDRSINFYKFSISSILPSNFNSYSIEFEHPASAYIKSINLIDESSNIVSDIPYTPAEVLTSPLAVDLDYDMSTQYAFISGRTYLLTLTFKDDTTLTTLGDTSDPASFEYTRSVNKVSAYIKSPTQLRLDFTAIGFKALTINVYEGNTITGTPVASKNYTDIYSSSDFTKDDTGILKYQFKNNIDISPTLSPTNYRFEYNKTYSLELVDDNLDTNNDSFLGTLTTGGLARNASGTAITTDSPNLNGVNNITIPSNYFWTGPQYSVSVQCLEYTVSSGGVGSIFSLNDGGTSVNSVSISLPYNTVAQANVAFDYNTVAPFTTNRWYSLKFTFDNTYSTSVSIETSRKQYAITALTFESLNGPSYLRFYQSTGSTQDVNIHTVSSDGTISESVSTITNVSSASSSSMYSLFNDLGGIQTFAYGTKYVLSITTSGVTIYSSQLTYILPNTSIRNLTVVSPGTSIGFIWNGGSFPADTNRSDQRIQFTLRDTNSDGSTINSTPGLFTDKPYIINSGRHINSIDSISSTNISGTNPVTGAPGTYRNIIYRLPNTVDLSVGDWIQINRVNPDVLNCVCIIDNISSSPPTITVKNFNGVTSATTLVDTSGFDDQLLYKIDKSGTLNDSSPITTTKIELLNGDTATNKYIRFTATSHSYTSLDYVSISGASASWLNLLQGIVNIVAGDSANQFRIRISAFEVPAGTNNGDVGTTSTIRRLLNPVNRYYTLYAFPQGDSSNIITRSTITSPYFISRFVGPSYVFNTTSGTTSGITSTIYRKYKAIGSYTALLQESSDGTAWIAVSASTAGSDTGDITNDHIVSTPLTISHALNAGTNFKIGYYYRIRYSYGANLLYVPDFDGFLNTLTSPITGSTVTVASVAPNVSSQIDGTAVNVSFSYQGGPGVLYLRLFNSLGAVNYATSTPAFGPILIPNTPTLTTSTILFPKVASTPDLATDGTTSYRYGFGFNTYNSTDATDYLVFASSSYTYLPIRCTAISRNTIASNSITLKLDFAHSTAFSNIAVKLTAGSSSTNLISNGTVSSSEFAASTRSITKTFNLTGTFSPATNYTFTFTHPDTNISARTFVFTYNLVSFTSVSSSFIDDAANNELGVIRLSGTLSGTVTTSTYTLLEKTTAAGASSPIVSVSNQNIPYIFSSSYLSYGNFYAIQYTLTGDVNTVSGTTSYIQYVPDGYDILVFAGQSNMVGRDKGTGSYGSPYRSAVGISSGTTIRTARDTTSNPPNSTYSLSSEITGTVLKGISVIIGGTTYNNCTLADRRLNSDDPYGTLIVPGTGTNFAVGTSVSAIANGTYDLRTSAGTTSVKYTVTSASGVSTYSTTGLGEIPVETTVPPQYPTAPTAITYTASGATKNVKINNEPSLTITGTISSRSGNTLTLSSGVSVGGWIYFTKDTGLTDSGNSKDISSFLQYYVKTASGNNITISYSARTSAISLTGSLASSVGFSYVDYSFDNAIAPFNSGADGGTTGVTAAYNFTELYAKNFSAIAAKNSKSDRRLAVVFRPRGATGISQWGSTTNLRNGLIGSIRAIQDLTSYPGGDSSLTETSYHRNRVVMFAWIQGEADAETNGTNWASSLNSMVKDIFDKTNTTYSDVVFMPGNLEYTHHSRMLDGVIVGTAARPFIADKPTYTSIMTVFNAIDTYPANLAPSALYKSGTTIPYQTRPVSSIGLHSIDPFTPEPAFDCSYEQATSVHLSARAERIYGMRFLNAYCSLIGVTPASSTIIPEPSSLSLNDLFIYNSGAGILRWVSSANSFDYTKNPVGYLITAFKSPALQSLNGSNAEHGVFSEHSGDGVLNLDFKTDISYLPYYNYTSSGISRGGISPNDNARNITFSDGTNIGGVGVSGSALVSSLYFGATRPNYTTESSVLGEKQRKTLTTDIRAFLQSVANSGFSSSVIDDVILCMQPITYDWADNTTPGNSPIYTIGTSSVFLPALTDIFANLFANYLQTERSTNGTQLVGISDIGSTGGFSTSLIRAVVVNPFNSSNINKALIVIGIYPRSQISAGYPAGTGGTADINVSTSSGVSTSYIRLGSTSVSNKTVFPKRCLVSYSPGSFNSQGSGALINRIQFKNFDWYLFYSEGQYNTISCTDRAGILVNTASGGTSGVISNGGFTSSQLSGVSRILNTIDGDPAPISELEPTGSKLYELLSIPPSNPLHYFFLNNTGTSVILRLKNMLPGKDYIISFYISTQSGDVPFHETQDALYTTGTSYPYLTNYLPVKLFTTTPTVGDAGPIITVISVSELDITIKLENEGPSFPPKSGVSSFPYKNQQIIFDTTMNSIVSGREYYISTVAAVSGSENYMYTIRVSEYPRGPTVSSGLPSTALSNTALIVPGGSLHVVSYLSSAASPNPNTIIIDATKPDMNGGSGTRAPVLGQEVQFSSAFAGIETTSKYYIRTSTSLSSGQYRITLSNTTALTDTVSLSSSSSGGYVSGAILCYYNSTRSITITKYVSTAGGSDSNKITFSSAIVPYVGQMIQFRESFGGVVAGTTYFISIIYSGTPLDSGLVSYIVKIRSTLAGSSITLSASASGVSILGTLVDVLADYSPNREYFRDGWNAGRGKTIENRLIFNRPYTDEGSPYYRDDMITTTFLHPNSTWNGSWKKITMRATLTSTYPSYYVDQAAYLQIGPIPSLRYTTPIIGIDMFYYVSYTTVNVVTNSTITITTSTPSLLQVGDTFFIYNVGGEDTGQNSVGGSINGNAQTCIAGTDGSTTIRITTPTGIASNTWTYSEPNRNVIAIPRSAFISSVSASSTSNPLTFTTKTPHNLQVGYYVQFLGFGRSAFNERLVRVTSVTSATVFTTTNYPEYSGTASSLRKEKLFRPYTLQISNVAATTSLVTYTTRYAHGLRAGSIIQSCRDLPTSGNAKYANFLSARKVESVSGLTFTVENDFNVPAFSTISVVSSGVYPVILLDKPNPLTCELEFINTTINIAGIEINAGGATDSFVDFP